MRILNLILVTMVLLQSVQALADLHQLHQLGTSHLDFQHDHSPLYGESSLSELSLTDSDPKTKCQTSHIDDKFAYAVDSTLTLSKFVYSDSMPKDLGDFDCHHCCHCHGAHIILIVDSTELSPLEKDMPRPWGYLPPNLLILPVSLFRPPIA